MAVGMVSTRRLPSLLVEACRVGRWLVEGRQGVGSFVLSLERRLRQEKRTRPQ